MSDPIQLFTNRLLEINKINSQFLKNAKINLDAGWKCMDGYDASHLFKGDNCL